MSGSSGIECRSVSGGATLVLNFDQPISAAIATISPTAPAKISRSPTFSGNAVLVNVTGLQNATAYTLTLTNASNTGGEISTVTVSLRTLLGDVNESGSVTAADVNTANGLVSSTPVTSSNFTSDVNLAGSVSKADVTTIKQNVGKSIAGGAAGVGSLSQASSATPATVTQTLFLATLGPQSNAPTSLGYGSATFLLNLDQSGGILRFQLCQLDHPGSFRAHSRPGIGKWRAGIILILIIQRPPHRQCSPFRMVRISGSSIQA